MRLQEQLQKKLLSLLVRILRFYLDSNTPRGDRVYLLFTY